MPADFIGFPVANVVDGTLSYIQHLFSNPDITPSSVRWNSDSRKSKIRIGGAFITDDERTASVPYIVVDRGPFSFANMAIDNLKSATPNTFEVKEHLDWMDGHINVVCGSSVASEASSMANFLAICFQADRKSLKSVLKFVRHISYIDIGPEDPIKLDTEVYIWEVTLRIKTSVYVGWIDKPKAASELFERASLQAEGDDDAYKPTTGDVSIGSANLIDTNADFGFFNDNAPQLLEQEMSKNLYNVIFDGDETRYKIDSIVNGTTLKLKQYDSDNNEVDFNPATSETREYRIAWNSVRIKIELPNATT